MSPTLPRRTAAVAVLAVTAASGVALSATSAAAHPHGKSHTSLSIRAVHRSINPGGGGVVKGDFRAANHHNTGRHIVLFQHAPDATSWSKAARHKTRSNGQVSFQVTPTETTRYQLRFGGNKKQASSRSGVVSIRVRDTTSLTISVGASSIEPGDSDTVNGVLSFDSAPLAGDTVRLLGGAKKAKRSYIASAITAADGSVSFSVRPPSTSHYVLAFKKTSVNAHARSSVATVHVRTPSSLSIRARQQHKHGREVISGDLRSSDKALAHKKVMLQDRPAGTVSWTAVGTKKTNNHGAVTFKGAKPTASEDYQLVFAGGRNHDGCQSGVVTVTVD